MSRGYSKFTLGGPAPQQAQPPALSPLAALGWQPFFAAQTDLDEMQTAPPVRVFEVNRSGLEVRGQDENFTLPPREDVTVGDWLMHSAEAPNTSRLLERKSLIKRRAAGHDARAQLIAANLETVFIVTSCNADFNIARLERYLALAYEAEITPVIVLTKTDLADDPQTYASQAAQLSDQLAVVSLNARSEEPLAKLAPWCKLGATVAFLGSSGVGKSTLVNTLSGGDAALTQTVREDDSKGRHTTTRRELHPMANGCLVLDTLGMRELQMTDAAAGIEAVFAYIETLAAQCRFNDCAHEVEPGCAVQQALERGELDAARVARWHKLKSEDAFNSASLHQRRSKDKAFGKIVRQATKGKKARRK